VRDFGPIAAVRGVAETAAAQTDAN